MINPWLAGASVHHSPNCGGSLEPKGIVLHYTASYSVGSAVGTLRDRKSRASAHFVVGLEGEIVQLVSLVEKAWHAGPSIYRGLKGLNTYTFGIEVVNPGWFRMLDAGGQNLLDSYGNRLTYRELAEFGWTDFVVEKHPRIGAGDFAWPCFPQAQLKAVEELCANLVASFPISFIVSHEEIDTRGWKTDPGPAFPIHRFRKLVDDRRDDQDLYVVTTDKLNQRTGPGVQYGRKGTLLSGDVVQMHKVVDQWMLVSHVSDDPNETFWVHTDYVVPAYG